MHDDALRPLLENSLSRELKEMLLNNPAPDHSYDSLVAHYQSLDIRLREYRSYQNQTLPAVPRSNLPPWPRRTSPPRGRSPPLPRRAPPPAGDPMDLSNQRRPLGPNRRENHLCYRCGSDTHYIRDCPEPDTRNMQARTGTIRRAHTSRSPDAQSIQPRTGAAFSLNPPRSPIYGHRRSTPSPDGTENGASLA
jgi:hypothetical protein